MAIGTTSTYAPTNVFLEKSFLSRLNPRHCFAKYIKSATIPTKNSGTIEYGRIERIAPLTGATSPNVKGYVEGIQPSDTSFTYTKIQISTALYANVIRISEQVDLLNERAILNQLVQLNAENLSDLQDLIIGANLNSGTQVYRLTDNIGGTSGAARSDVDGIINPVALDKATNLFERNNCEPLTEAISASSNYSTSPIDAAWIAITHPDVARDLRNMPGFIRVEEYSGGSKLDGEVGAYNRIRFVATTNAVRYLDAGGTVAGTRSNGGSAADVYITLLLSKDAAVTVDVASALQVVMHSANETDKADWLGLACGVGYKLRQGAGILEDARILRIESAATA